MGSAAKAVGAVADTAVSGVSLGTVKTNMKDGKSSVKASVSDAPGELVSTATGQKLLSDLQTMPEIPKPVDENTANNAANEAAAKKLADQKAGGINSTLLGGSVSADNSNLKKKKLLGE